MAQHHAVDLFSFNAIEIDHPPAAKEEKAIELPVKPPAAEQDVSPPAPPPAPVEVKTAEIEAVSEPAPEAEAEIEIEAEAATPRTPGRPRSETSRSAILDATRRLVSHTSVRDLSIEGIAKKAGVGKTTIYRWWPNKVAVVIEAFADSMDVAAPVTGSETPDATTALLRHLERLLRQLRGRNGKIIADLFAESQCDAKVMAQFDTFYMTARRQEVETLIAAGQADGSFNPDIPADIAVDIVLGPVFLRLLGGADGLNEDFSARWPALAAAALR